MSEGGTGTGAGMGTGTPEARTDTGTGAGGATGAGAGSGEGAGSGAGTGRAAGKDAGAGKGRETAPRPSARGAAVGRRIGIGLMNGLWRPRVLGAERVPASGPALFAVNHSHNIDGPMVMGTAPRPVHFLIKKEAFVGPLGSFLRGIGQVRIDRSVADRAAIGDALRVLEDGGVLGIFPEGSRGDGDFAALRSGLAYFAVRSGAPVVPVAVLGSAERRGRAVGALPPLRSRIDIVFGDPFQAGEPGGRRTRAAMDSATVRIQERLTAHLAEARRSTGRGTGESTGR